MAFIQQWQKSTDRTANQLVGTMMDATRRMLNETEHPTRVHETLLEELRTQAVMFQEKKIKKIKKSVAPPKKAKKKAKVKK